MPFPLLLRSEDGMTGIMEHDGWASPAEEDEAKWAEKWAEGLSASDDDSDGDGDDSFKPTDPCTYEEIVLRRKKHLEKLQRLYHLQVRLCRRPLLVLGSCSTGYHPPQPWAAAADL